MLAGISQSYNVCCYETPCLTSLGAVTRYAGVCVTLSIAQGRAETPRGAGAQS